MGPFGSMLASAGAIAPLPVAAGPSMTGEKLFTSWKHSSDSMLQIFVHVDITLRWENLEKFLKTFKPQFSQGLRSSQSLKGNAC